eukprot:4793736-Prymnesium_polylepis.1
MHFKSPRARGLKQIGTSLSSRQFDPPMGVGYGGRVGSRDRPQAASLLHSKDVETIQLLLFEKEVSATSE